jgi:hypothetical protein
MVSPRLTIGEAAMTQLKDAVERVDEALFNLSDSIRQSGMLDIDLHHARYETSVKAWTDLRTILDALDTPNLSQDKA